MSWIASVTDETLFGTMHVEHLIRHQLSEYVGCRRRRQLSRKSGSAAQAWWRHRNAVAMIPKVQKVPLGRASVAELVYLQWNPQERPTNLCSSGGTAHRRRVRETRQLARVLGVWLPVNGPAGPDNGQLPKYPNSQ